MASIDVAIPCYQYGRYLRECVTSVLTQNNAAVRVLIIDNASTDDSLQIAREIAREDGRVEVIAHATNLGQHASYNEAIDWARSDFFLVLDADDRLLPGAIQRSLPFMENNPDVVFSYGNPQYIGLDDELLSGAEIAARAGRPAIDERGGWQVVSGENFITQFCRRGYNVIAPSTVVRRTWAQKKAGYYRPELPYTDDVELWLRLATLGNVACTSQRQAAQRLHSARHSVNYTNKIEHDFIEREAAFDSFFAHEGKTLDNAASLLACARQSLAAHAYWSAGSQLFKGRLRSSRDLMQFALVRRPSMVFAPPIRWLVGFDRPFTRIRTALSVPVRALAGFMLDKWQRIA